MAAANYGSLSERAQDTASTPTSPIDWDSDEPVAVNLSASMRQKRRRERKSAETSIEIVQGGDTDAPDGAEECPLAEDAPLLPPGRNGDSVTVSEPMTNSFGEQVFGIGLVVLAGMTFTGSNVLQNFFVKDVNFFFLLAVRAIMQLVVTDLDLKCSGNNVFGGETNLKARFKIVLQGLFGGILLLCIFYSVTHIPLGNASAIFFLTPTMTFILAPFMLRERTGIFRIAVIVCMLAGVIMIDRPTIFYPSDVPYHNHSQPTNASTTTTPAPAIARPDTTANLFNYFICFSVPIISAVVSILTRHLRHLRPTVLMYWFGIGALIVGAGGCMICVDVKHIVDGLSLFQWVIVLTICAMGLFGNIVYTTAMKYVSPTKGNVFRSFEVITNYVLQIYLQGCAFHPSAIFGISFLSMSVVLIGSESILRTKLANRFPYLHRIW